MVRTNQVDHARIRRPRGQSEQAKKNGNEARVIRIGEHSTTVGAHGARRGSGCAVGAQQRLEKIALVRVGQSSQVVDQAGQAAAVDVGGVTCARSVATRAEDGRGREIQHVLQSRAEKSRIRLRVFVANERTVHRCVREAGRGLLFRGAGQKRISPNAYPST